MNRFDRLPHIAARYQRRRTLYEGTGLWPTSTLQRAFLDALATKPGQEWTFVTAGVPVKLTLGELGAAASSFAARLAASSAASADDVLAIVLPNSAGAVTSFFGAQLIGLTGFPTSMREGRESMRELFERVGVAHVVLDQDDATRREWIDEFIANGLVKEVWLADVHGNIRSGRTQTHPPEEGRQPELPETIDGVHLIAYTSGSTSEPKIVLHTDAELLAESHSLAEVFGHFDTMLVAAPIGHITGILHLLTLPLVRDGDVVSIDRWEVDAALEACRTFGAETLAGTSLYFQQMFDRDAAMGGVKGGIAGGGPVAPVIVQRAERESGIKIVRSYGSTEHPTISQSLPTDVLEKRALTDGSLNLGVEVRIIDPLGGDVPIGASGEILSRGPDAMAGYLDPELDAETYTTDGWFHTGDVGVIDDAGFLTITDRIKDLIIRAGENISAKEVEDIIQEWSEVVEVAVVGIPDPQYGERACAFVLSRNSQLDLDGLRKYLATTRLERFKWPERVVLVGDFPRTPSGKVRKKELRDSWEPLGTDSVPS